MDQEQSARNRMRAANIALPVLIARAGGSVEITDQEFDELVARYGGASQMTIRMERVGSTTLRLTLVRKPPQQGELPV